MATKWYGKGLYLIQTRSIDWVSDTLKVMLVNASYTFDNQHDFVDDINANELSGTGYTGGFAGAGRKTLASKAINHDTANQRIEFDAADPSAWTGLNAGTIAWAIIIKEITNDAASIPVCALDPTNLVTNGSDVTLVFDAEGLVQINYA